MREGDVSVFLGRELETYFQERWRGLVENEVVLVRGEVMNKFFLEEKKKDCLKMIPAPLFPSACCYLGVHVLFCALGGFLEDKAFGRGQCVAEVCVLFIEVRGVHEPCHGIQGFCFDVIFEPWVRGFMERCFAFLCKPMRI